MANEIDIKLTDDCTDFLVEKGDLVFVSGPDELVQRLTVKLRWFYGEYAFDLSKGVRYHEDVFIKNPNIPSIDSMLKKAILEDVDVVRLIYFSSTYDSAKRSFRVEFSVESVYGEVPTSVIVEV